MALSKLPQEILNVLIGRELDDKDWRNLRLTCSLMRNLFPINQKYGPVIHASGPRIGDRSSRYISWREKPVDQIQTDLALLFSVENFVIQIISDEAWNTARKVLSAINAWDELLTCIYEESPKIFSQLFQRYIYLCPDKKVSTKWKSIVYNHEDWENLFRLSLTNRETCQKLIQAGIDVNFRVPNSGGNTALSWASRDGSTEVVQLLLAAGAYVDHSNNYGYTALIWACRHGHTEIVELLLAAGANVDHRNHAGNTALILASWDGHTEIVRLLFVAGANVHHSNNQGNTALIWACRHGHTEVVLLLLAAGANVDYRNHARNTALIRASQNGHAEVVPLLLAAGAEVDYRGNQGHTALIFASQNGHEKIVQLLTNTQSSTDKNN